MKVILLGCKDFPAFKYGKDVGGIEVFCNDILNRIKNIKFYLFVRRYKNSPKEEKFNNIKIYRTSYINLPLLKTVSFNFLAFFKALKIKSDIIWAHEPSAGFFAYFLSKIKKIPYILHIHSRGSLEQGPFLRRFGLKILEYLAYKNPAKTIFVSKNLINELSKKGIFIPVGIDTKKFKNNNKLQILNKFKDNKKICFIGRLHKIKGINYLIQAFSQLENKDLVLLIVGEGNQKQELENLAKKLKIQDKVIFLNNQKAENILPFVNLLVLPSLSEGTPHSILEALYCKIPIVASNIGEIPNLINSYLVQPGNINDLKDKIELALKEKKIADFKEEYLIENIVKKIENVLK